MANFLKKCKQRSTLKAVLLFAVVIMLLGAMQVFSLSWPSGWIPLNTSETEQNSLRPALAIAFREKTGEGDQKEQEPTVFLSWIEESQTMSLKLAKSEDRGDGFKPITTSPSTSLPSQASPVIVAQQAGEKPLLFIAWEEGLLGTREIWLSQSVDGGEKFSTPVNVSCTPQADSHSPALALDGQGGVYIAWVDATLGNEEIFLQHFAQGAMLPAPLNVSRSPTPSLNPTIAVARNQIYVAWEEDDLRGNREIFFQSSAPFSSPMNLSNSSRPSRNPDLATDDQGHLFLVWEEEIGGGNVEIFFRRSIDNLRHRDLLPPLFDLPFNISDSPLPSQNPAITVSSKGLAIVWEEGGEILLRSSTDTFQPPLNLSRTPSLSKHPIVAALEELVVVAWEEQLHGNWEILTVSNQATTPAALIEDLESKRSKALEPDVQIHLAQAIEYAQRISGANPRDDLKNEALTIEKIFEAGEKETDTENKAFRLLDHTASLLTQDEKKKVICEIWEELSKAGKALSERLKVKCE